MEVKTESCGVWPYLLTSIVAVLNGVVLRCAECKTSKSERRALISCCLLVVRSFSFYSADE